MDEHISTDGQTQRYIDLNDTITETIKCEKRVWMKYQLSHRNWYSFIDFIKERVVIDKEQHTNFYHSFQEALYDSNIYVQDYFGRGTTFVARRLMAQRDLEKIFIVVVDSRTKTHELYKVTPLQFRRIIAYCFLSGEEWIKSVEPEKSIPSFILSAIPIVFGTGSEIAKRMNVSRELLEMPLEMYDTIDIFQLSKVYKRNELEEGEIEQSEDSEQDSVITNQKKRTLEEPEEEQALKRVKDSREERWKKENRGRKRFRIKDNSFLVFNDYTVEDMSLESFNDTEFQLYVVDKEICSREWYNKSLYFVTQERRCKYKNGRYVNVHPYDLGFYLYTEAKRKSRLSGLHVSVEYNNVLTSFMTLSDNEKSYVFDRVEELRSVILGNRTTDNINFATLFLDHRIGRVEKHGKRGQPVEYHAKFKGDTVMLRFSRGKVDVMDIYFGFLYFRLKYKTGFNVDIVESITWDQYNVRITLPKTQYEFMTKNIFYYETVSYYTQTPIVFYPVLVQRYLHGNRIEKMEASYTILKLCKNYRASKCYQKMWVYYDSAEEENYMNFLPSIIKKYWDIEAEWKRVLEMTLEGKKVEYTITGRMKEYLVELLSESDNYISSEQITNWEDIVSFASKLQYKGGIKAWNRKYYTPFDWLESFFAIRGKHLISIDTLCEFTDYLNNSKGEYCQGISSIKVVLHRLRQKVNAGCQVQSIKGKDYVEIPSFIEDSCDKEEEKMESGPIEVKDIKTLTIYHIYEALSSVYIDRSVALNVLEGVILKPLEEEFRIEVPSWWRKRIELNKLGPIKQELLDKLKHCGMYSDSFMTNVTLQEKSTFKKPSKAEIFCYFLEYLERLSYYYYKTFQKKHPDNDEKFKGFQKQPMPENRWIPFNNSRVALNNVDLSQLPVLLHGHVRTGRDTVLLHWKMYKDNTGTIHDMAEGLDIDSKWKPLSIVDKEFVNCVLLKPPLVI